jgi:2-polyprenyl-3-methyl-5-hydroxy-6-metoxy-1,4-benzoquinol methylase
MTPFDLSAFATNLERTPEGIWVARGSLKDISYPEDGNLNCLALEADSFWFEHRNHCIEAAMRILPPAGVVFDIGGGNGYVAHSLQQMGFPVALVEPGWQGVQNARRRGVETLVCSSLEDAGFQPDSLPAVSFFDVLEHIQKDKAFLKLSYDLLVPGGRLYLTVPAYQELWSADDDYAGHYRRYNRPGLLRLLQEVGLQVEFASYIFFLLPLPIFLFRVIPTRLGLRKKNAWDKYGQEHHTQPGLLGKLLEKTLEWELNLIRQRRQLPLGGSCLIVARKTD